MLFTTVFSAGSQAYAATWNLTGDTNVHDPSYIKEGNTHWVFSTGSGLQVMFSNDGTNYIRSLPIYNSKPSWWSSYVPNQEGLDVWAPEIFYYNGTYYLYYSISTFGSRVSAIGLVTTKSISGENGRTKVSLSRQMTPPIITPLILTLRQMLTEIYG